MSNIPGEIMGSLRADTIFLFYLCSMRTQSSSCFSDFPNTIQQDLYLTSCCLCTLHSRYTRVLQIPQIDHYCVFLGIHTRRSILVELLISHAPLSSSSSFPGKICGLSSNVTASRKSSFILQDQISLGSPSSCANSKQKLSYRVLVRALLYICSGEPTQIRGEKGNLSSQVIAMARVELVSKYVVNLHPLLVSPHCISLSLHLLALLHSVWASSSMQQKVGVG